MSPKGLRYSGSSNFEHTQDTTNAEIDSLDVHGESQNSSKTDEGIHTPCIFCSNFQLSWRVGVNYRRGGTPPDLYHLLHEECSTCRLPADSETQLCAFCQHIRLRHILGCLSEFRTRFGREYSTLNLEVDFGDLEEIQSRQNCGLCRLVTDTVSIYTQEIPESNGISITNFAKLDIKLSTVCPKLWISSNLLKGPVTIAGKDLRPCRSERDKIDLLEAWPRPSRKGISWDRILKSLPNIKPSPIGHLPEDFRLIHVQQRRCVPVGPSFGGTFVALSYVWGCAMGVNQAWSTTDLHNPPHTIADALHACQQLGHDYLWVDQICIKQDDPMDKANQIASMAAIYSSASLVIVAARGENVHSGISGMHLARGKLQARESFLGFEFSSKPDFDRDISSSIWSTRGWTFQEVALNKIRLYFSSPGVWLNFEEPQTETQYAVDFDQTTRLTSRNYSIIHEFSNRLREYTPRKLTYEHDIYNAFSGILMALFGGPDEYIYGLPKKIFDNALLWAPSGGGPPPSIRVFRNNLDRDPNLNLLLPTWTWASLKGEVETLRMGTDDVMFPLVKWACIAPSSQPPTPTLIEPQMEECAAFGTEYYFFKCMYYLAILWSYSCFDSPSPFTPQPNGDTFPSWGNLNQRWPSPRDFWDDVSSRGSRSPTYPGLDIPGLTGQDDSKIAQLQPGMLLTRAESAHVWVDPDGCLRDCDHGVRIGQLFGGDRGLIPRGDSSKTGVFKCIAISLAQGSSPVIELIQKRSEDSGQTREDILSGDKSWDLNFPQRRWEPYTPTPVVNVMLTVREGQFSYRLGVGWILFRRWIDAKRIFETILLK